jgi:hypothetical protein
MIMEMVAENSFSLTEGLFREGMGCLSRNSYGKTATKWTLILLLLWGIISALLLFLGGPVSQILVYLAAILFLCYWLNVAAPRKHAKKAWDALLSRSGDDPQRTTRFYPDHLEVDAGGTVKTVPYGDVLQIRETKNLIMLICADKTGVMVAKNGFTIGNYEEIIALIRSASR